MKNKNILFVTKRFYTNKDLLEDRFGRNYELPVGLKKLGFNVTVICWDYYTQDTFEDDIEGVRFINLRCRGLGALTFFIKTGLILQRFKPHYIVGSGDSYFGFLALFLGKIFHAKTLFDVYDFYPCFGTNRLPGMKKLFYMALKHCDYIYCASKPLESLAKKFNSNVLYIPNGVNLDTFHVTPIITAKKAVGFNPDLQYIGYFGSLSETRGASDLVEALEKIRQLIPSVQLVMAGKIEGVVNLAAVGNIYLGEISQEQVARYVNACDVVTLPYRESVFMQYSNSCKTMEYIACDKPIVATRVANFTENYVDINWEDFAGALCQPNDIADMARALQWQLEHQYKLPSALIMTWTNLTDRLVAIF